MIKYIFPVLLLIFSGCSVKQLEKHSKMLVFKTKQIRFADLAYIAKGEDSLEIDLYVVGKAFKKISIDGMVCVEGEGCMRKSSFNEEYLAAAYPDDLLKNVFLGKAIYKGQKLQKTASGFEQNIATKDVEITYKVRGDVIYFKDRKNKILIKMKDVK